MEGYGPNEYRNNLAKDIQEARSQGEEGKLDAQKKLLEAETSEEYNVAKDLKIATHEAAKRYGGKSFEEENRELDRQMEEMGFDVHDISEKIPKDISLLIEESRYSPISISEERKINSYFDELSEHKYLSNKCLNHVSRENPHHSTQERKNKNHAEEKLLGKQRSFVEQLKIDGFFFAIGENTFAKVDRPLFIFSTENPNFKAFLLSEVLDNDEPVFGVEIRRLLLNEGVKNIDKVIEMLKEDEVFQKLVSSESQIVEKDGEEVYVIESVGYHSQYSPKVVAYLLLLGKRVELSNNTSGIRIDGSRILSNMMDNKLFDRKGKHFSFATLADTIIDLISHKVYKFNIEKFENS